MNSASFQDRDGGAFAVDTTFVLFFLAVEFGRTLFVPAFDTALMAISIAAVMILPFYLIPEDDRPHFRKWVLGRGIIASFATALGIAFSQSLGVLVPELFRFLPMTLLIVTAFASCCMQFYGFSRFRLAR